jgi:hypothetical protein
MDKVNYREQMLKKAAERKEEERKFREHFSTWSLDELKMEKNRLYNEAGELQIQASKIAQLLEERAVEVFRSNKHLKKYHWTLSTNEALTALYLEAQERDDYEFSKLADSGDMYHFSHEIEKGVTLRSDDGDLTISFMDQNRIVPFIEEWELDVDSTVLDKYEEKNRKALESVQTLKKIMAKE